MHYIRALFITLKMTLRGQQIPEAELRAWMQQAERLINAAYEATSDSGLDSESRQAFSLHLERRDVSMETILAAVRHHVTEEYRYLLHDRTPHSIAAIYAANLDDRYRVMHLSQAQLPPGVRAALLALSAHLDAIPARSTG